MHIFAPHDFSGTVYLIAECEVGTGAEVNAFAFAVAERRRIARGTVKVLGDRASPRILWQNERECDTASAGGC
jgi:hypothetical protein